MTEKQKRLKAEEIIKILSAHGFEKVRQKGSHQKWKNYETEKQVIVTYHKGKQLPIVPLYRFSCLLGKKIFIIENVACPH